MKIIRKLKIPRKFINDFDAFDVLDLSKEEHEIIRNIWYHTKNTNCENLIACYDKGKTDILNDGLYSKVMLLKNIVNKKNLKIYHGHTDISCLSKIDLLKLSKDNVICVSCVTYNGYVYVVRKRDRSIYSESEMSDKYDIIKNDVAIYY